MPEELPFVPDRDAHAAMASLPSGIVVTAGEPGTENIGTDGDWEEYPLPSYVAAPVDALSPTFEGFDFAAYRPRQ